MTWCDVGVRGCVARHADVPTQQQLAQMQGGDASVSWRASPKLPIGAATASWSLRCAPVMSLCCGAGACCCGCGATWHCVASHGGCVCHVVASERPCPELCAMDDAAARLPYLLCDWMPGVAGWVSCVLVFPQPSPAYHPVHHVPAGAGGSHGVTGRCVRVHCPRTRPFPAVDATVHLLQLSKGCPRFVVCAVCRVRYW